MPGNPADSLRAPTWLLVALPVARRGAGALLRGLHLHRAWLAVGAVALVDTVWSRHVGLTLGNARPFAIVLCCLLASTVLLRALAPGSRIAGVTEMLALWQGFALSGNLLTYLAATPGLPLQDTAFAAADRALGFDWLAVERFVRAAPG